MTTKKGSLMAIGGGTLALFVLLAVYMKTNLAYIAGWGDALTLGALYALVAGGAVAVYAHIVRPDVKGLCAIGAATALTMLARVSMLDFISGDYHFFLTGWVDIFREGGAKMLAEKVGDYNLIYQYFLLLISKSPIKDLYLIKFLSVAMDYALALSMMCAAGHYGGKAARAPVYLLTLVLPTVLLNGACWAQCDSVYVFFIIMSLYLLETDRPMLSAASLAVAFSFKLQTIFFFPVVLLGLIHKRYTIRHAAMFFASYVLTLVPAMLAGRSFMSAISVYASQSMGQYYDRLTYNAPNLYNFFPLLEFNPDESTWMRYIEGFELSGTQPYLSEPLMMALQNASLAACIILTLLVVCYWLIHFREVTPDMTLDLALFFAIFLPFVMPKIHDRYFFLADMLSVLYAVRHPRRRFLPALVIVPSLMSYVMYLMRQRPVSGAQLSVMMLAALVIVSRDLLVNMRKNRAALKGGVRA